MSYLDKLKTHMKREHVIRLGQGSGGGGPMRMPYGSYTKNYSAHMQIPGSIGGPDSTIVLPCKRPSKRRKLDQVEIEAKETQHRIEKANERMKGGGGGMDAVEDYGEGGEDKMSDEEGEEDKEKSRPKKIPWGPPAILQHLDDDTIVSNLENIIQSVKLRNPTWEDEKDKERNNKEDIIVWDHSKTKEGLDSDMNFYLWLEAYAANQCKKDEIKDRAIFSL